MVVLLGFTLITQPTKMVSCSQFWVFLLGFVLTHVCMTDQQTVRLSGGYSKSSGRVEVLHSGQWGTVCQRGWDNNDAKVVCRMLGYSKGTPYYYAVFGVGSGLILMSNLDCTGSESSLFDCPFPGWGGSTCTHSEDAGVVCFNDTDHSEVAVRLMERDGYYNSSGRVEVFYDGYWGYIGPYNWDNNAAMVVCRMLGYSIGHSASTFTHYHQSNNRQHPTWMDYVQCSGSETTIADCPFRGWGQISDYYRSNHQSTVFVACTSQKDSDEFAVRLMGGFSNTSGRVEVFYDGQWGTICRNYWDNKEAEVVCRMLGFSESISYFDRAFPRGSGMVWMNYVQCSGREAKLYDCSFDGWGSTCSHDLDVGVFCFNNTDGSEVAVRLVEVDGYHNRSGRVEVFYAGLWGYVAYEKWDDRDADVVCRMLGYRTGKGRSIYHDVDLRNLQHPTWMNNVQCNGSESSIADCPFDGWGSTYFDSRMYSAFVSCLSDTDVDEFAVQLVGGFSNTSGRVEVFYDGRWGTICLHHWDDKDAEVVCRMLGYRETVNYAARAFPYGTDMVWMNTLRCSGTEVHLYDCSFDGWGSKCSHQHDVGVFCFNNTDGSEVAVRLVEVDGYHNRSGRVEVFYGGLWGYVANGNWDDRDANVVCRMLGYRTGKGRSIYHNVDLRNLQHPTWMNNVQCNGSESSIADCPFDGWGSTYFNSWMYSAFVSCLSDTDIDEFAVQLVGGFSNTSGRVEVFYDGRWGTICLNHWDDKDAEVVCRMLGYRETVNYAARAFPYGTDMVWMNYVHCSGTEVQLYDCSFDGWGSKCSHQHDVGVFCFNNTDGSEVAVRLVEVDGYHNRSGRVEVFYAGLWGYVGNGNWDDRDADVVCRMVGYRTGKGRSIYQNVDLRNLQHPTWMNNVQCNGSESSIADCPFDGWGSTYFNSWMYSAFVSCLSDTDIDEFAVQLVGGFSNTSGRVEVFYDGRWGTICLNHWDDKDAEVVCRMLGYRETVNYAARAFPYGTDMVWMNYVHCSGTEVQLYDCSFDGWGSKCSHQHDVGVFCFNNTDGSEVAVRLVEVDGYHNRSGRVEVFYAGLWGYVANGNWDNRDANVVCRMLGYRIGKGRSIYHNVDLRNLQHPTWMNNVQCNGSESSIADCPFEGWGSTYFSSGMYSAFVSCLSETDVAEHAVRLVGGFSNSSGRVEVFYSGQWGAVCDTSWDNNDAQVACRMLGYRRGSGYRYAAFGRGNGITWMGEVDCSGSESNLYDCSFDGWGSQCPNMNDVGVVCFNDSDIADVQFRLTEVEGYNKSSGIVEVFYGGHWGFVGATRWQVNDAHVACRMFGYSSGSAHTYRVNFSPRVKPTWMDSVECIGSESNLADCSFAGWGVYQGAGASYQYCAFVKCTGLLDTTSLPQTTTTQTPTTTLGRQSTGLVIFINHQTDPQTTM